MADKDQFSTGEWEILKEIYKDYYPVDKLIEQILELKSSESLDQLLADHREYYE